MKLDLYITSPEEFARGGEQLNWAFDTRLASNREFMAAWYPEKIFVTEIEFDDALIDTDKVRKAAEAEIDKMEQKARAEYAKRMAEIERRRGELLALPGKSE